MTKRWSGAAGVILLGLSSTWAWNGIVVVVLVLLFLAAVVFSPHDAPTQRLRALVREVKRDGTRPPRVAPGEDGPRRSRSRP